MSLLTMLVLDLLDSKKASYNSPMQSVAEDVEYEEVSETKTSEKLLISSKDEETQSKIENDEG